MDTKNRIDKLSYKLDTILQRQNNFMQAIQELQTEIEQLKETYEEEVVTFEEEYVEEVRQEEILVAPQKEFVPEPQRVIVKEPPATPIPFTQKESQIKSNLEKFIGENLLSKIGIVVLVIGVAIGVKYAIEHQWITPLMRIVLGYMVGGGLLGFAFKLKKKYLNFSAVLLSGASAIMYFITYFAYGFYDLIPQIPTFGLMFVFTAFTVGAAINYNRQIIAHIGLVGAYAVPFLLSDGSGKIAVLLSYMAIINVGILVVSIKKYWKPLFYTSFGLTWLIYFSWFAFKYEPLPHFGLALKFLILFFILFYVMFLAYFLVMRQRKNGIVG